MDLQPPLSAFLPDFTKPSDRVSAAVPAPLPFFSSRSGSAQAIDGMSRRYLNLVLYDFESGTYPVCRIDFCKHLFYGNSEIAQVAGGENKIK
jgi:hypothetical protein